MKHNFPGNERLIDEEVKKSYSRLNKSYVFIKKTKIKTWQSVFIIAFITGLAVAIILTISTGLHVSTGAAIDCGPCFKGVCDDVCHPNKEGLDCPDCQPSAVCGNGIVEIGEECDGVDLAGQSCLDFGFDSGILNCQLNCSLDTLGCILSGNNCGDGICAGDGEDCLTCPADCSKTISSYCGDGVCNSGEECNNCQEDCESGIAIPQSDCSECFKGVCDGNCNTAKENTNCPDCVQEFSYCCGDNFCDIQYCGEDCGSTGSIISCCGNMSCEGEESPENCQADCFSCTDSDSGSNYNIFGTTIGYDSYGSDIDNIANYTDQCESNNMLMEFYCEYQNDPHDGAGYVSMENIECEYGCTNGRCLAVPLCQNSDGGKNYYVKGLTTGVIAWQDPVIENIQTNEDYCTTACQFDPESGKSDAGPCLVEFECANHPDNAGDTIYASAEVYHCPNGCSKGACVDILLYIVPDSKTLLRVSSYVKNDGVDNPLIIYTPGMEEEILQYIDSFQSSPYIKMVYLENDVFLDLEDALIGRSIPFTAFGIEGLSRAHDFIGYTDITEFEPYAAAYAGKNNGLYLDSLVDVQNRINSIPDQKIYYFGNNLTTLNQLANISSNIDHINTLENAEIILAPTDSEDKIVTVIPGIPSDYSRLGVLYAIYRDTALISVTGIEGDTFSFDQSVDEQLNLIKPYNNSEEYDYMVIVADWYEIPYNYVIPNNIHNWIIEPYKHSSDMVYADRNSFWSESDIGDDDKHFIPDISVGRILGYDLTSASMILSRGYFYENNLLHTSEKAIFVHDKPIDGSVGLQSPVIADTLSQMYGVENVFAKGDQPSNDLILPLLKDRELIFLTGHGWPRCMNSTFESINSAYVLPNRPYKPAFWLFWACATIAHYSEFPGAEVYTDTILDAALRSSAINVYGSVEVACTFSGDTSWYMPYFASGKRIGDIIRLGLIDADASDMISDDYWECCGIDPNAPSQYQLIGDPLVRYGNN